MRKGNWVDFKEVRARVTIEETLRFLGVDTLTRREGKLMGPCPVHGGDNPRAFHVDTNKSLWFCFTGCQRGGNQLDLVAAVRDISVRDAALALKRHFLNGNTIEKAKESEAEQLTRSARTAGGGTPPRVTRESKTQPTPLAETPKEAAPTERETRKQSIPRDPNPVLNISLALAADHPHIVEERRLSIETAEHFGIGYCSRGILRGTIAVPIHNRDGELVAYAGRRLKPQQIAEHGKYRFPKGFARDLELYNLHRAMTHLEEMGYLILVEGFFAVMRLAEYGYPNAIASMGARLSSEQAQLLSEIPEVVIIYDGDDAGTIGEVAARELLEANGVIVRTVTLPVGMSPDEMDPRAIRWLVNGIGALDLSHVAIATVGRVS